VFAKNFQEGVGSGKKNLKRHEKIDLKARLASTVKKEIKKYFMHLDPSKSWLYGENQGRFSLGGGGGGVWGWVGGGGWGGGGGGWGVFGGGGERKDSPSKRTGIQNLRKGNET